MKTPSIVQQSLLPKWLKAEYLSPDKIKHLKTTFLAQFPFPYLELRHFFLEEKVRAIKQALEQETFLPQQADLFQFKQTSDFAMTTNKTLQEFHTFLCSPEFIGYMGYLTSTTLLAKSIDMSGTLYEDTDYLLCHDDQLEGRKIAYFFYLSDLEKNDGGALHLFSTKDGIPTEAAAVIIPKFNTFSFFLVSEKSFHEVSEVVRDVKRIAISGWFHGEIKG